MHVDVQELSGFEEGFGVGLEHFGVGEGGQVGEGFGGSLVDDSIVLRGLPSAHCLYKFIHCRREGNASLSLYLIYPPIS